MKVLDFKPRLFSTLKNYSKETFMSDLMAGIIVGIVALPLAIAFGIASGVSPEKGIITAIIAGFIISLLGGSKVQIGGPTGAFIVIIYGIIQQYGEAGLIVLHDGRRDDADGNGQKIRQRDRRGLAQAGCRRGHPDQHVRHVLALRCSDDERDRTCRHPGHPRDEPDGNLQGDRQSQDPQGQQRPARLWEPETAEGAGIQISRGTPGKSSRHAGRKTGSWTAHAYRGVNGQR